MCDSGIVYSTVLKCNLFSFAVELSKPREVDRERGGFTGLYSSAQLNTFRVLGKSSIFIYCKLQYILAKYSVPAIIAI